MRPSMFIGCQGFVRNDAFLIKLEMSYANASASYLVYSINYAVSLPQGQYTVYQALCKPEINVIVELAKWCR